MTPAFSLNGILASLGVLVYDYAHDMKRRHGRSTDFKGRQADGRTWQLHICTGIS